MDDLGLPEMLTVSEVARVLRASGGKVRRMLRTGQLEGAKVGRNWLIPKSEVLRLLHPVKLAGEGRELTREQLEAAGQKRLLEGSGRSGGVRYDAPGLKAPRIIG